MRLFRDCGTLVVLLLFASQVADADEVVVRPKFRPDLNAGVSGNTVPVTIPTSNLTTPTTTPAFDITINFLGGLTPSQEAIFSQAEATWETLITGYQPGITLTGITIGAQGQAIDGTGGILGQAGPTFGVNEGGYALATQGIMQFDSADLTLLELSGSLGDVILHEMAHVLGLGILWNGPILHPAFAGTQVVSISGSGQYTGVNALNMYRSEFNQPAATFVPVELGGGAGTANSHWDEVDFGLGTTGIVTSVCCCSSCSGSHQDFRNELMTGWLNAPSFISRTTVMSFQDIGFTVNVGSITAVPEPSAFLFVSLVGLGCYLATKRRD